MCRTNSRAERWCHRSHRRCSARLNEQGDGGLSMVTLGTVLVVSGVKPMASLRRTAYSRSDGRRASRWHNGRAWTSPEGGCGRRSGGGELFLFKRMQQITQHCTRSSIGPQAPCKSRRSSRFAGRGWAFYIGHRSRRPSFVAGRTVKAAASESTV